jgi:pimeloyl-ACP methyl ester carboxylesterase
MIESKTIEVDSRTIHFRESAGPGLPLLFVHGNSSSGGSFEHQLAAPLLGRHRMIALDLPGHGSSSNAHDPQSVYSLPGYAAILREFAQRLGIENAIFVGWSLGGHIVLEAAHDLPEASGFLIYGTPPVGLDMAGGPFLPHPAMATLFQGALTDTEVGIFGDSLFQSGTPVPETFRADLRRTDCLARSGLGESVQGGRFTDEREIVANIGKPLAVIHGAEDQLINVDYIRVLRMPTLWRGAVQMIPGAGHAVHWEQPARFNALLAAFASEC